MVSVNWKALIKYVLVDFIPIILLVVVVLKAYDRHKMNENGFRFTTTASEIVAGLNLAGKVALVTGGAGLNGIGFETCRVLAEKGVLVYLTGRSLDQAEQAAEVLRSTTDKPVQVIPMQLDVANLTSIEKFAQDFTLMSPKLHYLIANAGVMAIPQKHLTVDGFEMQMGTNHFGHFHLINLLTNTLIQSAPSNIVLVSSSAHMMADLKFLENPSFDCEPYLPLTAYGNSKLANMLHAAELERRLGDKGVHSFSVMPGMIPTDLSRHLPSILVGFLNMTKFFWMRTFMKTIPQGAATQVWAATRGTAAEGGRFLRNSGPAAPTRYGALLLEAGAGRAFWERSARAVEAARAAAAAAAGRAPHQDGGAAAAHVDDGDGHEEL